MTALQMKLNLLKKNEEKNEENSPQNMSFDFKLFFVYHIAMMILFGARPIDNPINQAIFAGSIGTAILIISVAHKIKYRWNWPGLSWTSIPASIFNLAFLYGFFAFAGYSMNPNVSAPDFLRTDIFALLQELWTIMLQGFNLPTFTPWFLAGIGIMVFGILSNLKLVTLKKDEFEAQCNPS